MRTSILFLITTIIQINFCSGQNDSLRKASCDTAKLDALNNIRENKLSFIQFGLLDASQTYPRLLSLNGISTEYKNCDVYDDAFYYSCYNNHIKVHIDSVYGEHFLDSIKKLSVMMDEIGLGDRTPYPLGISSLRSYLDEKVKSSSLDIPSISNKVIQLRILIDKQGKIKTFTLISGDQKMFELIKDELSKLIWTNATDQGVPYELEVPLTYLYKDK